uniref:Brix domain-containing protein n=1 Tax=Parastrongyloides trichosuri TaxID=131310 RepID=A0A0N4ZJ98_PARTI
MHRREARLRREYSLRKITEEKQKALEAKRDRIRQAIQTNTPIPNDLKHEAVDILKDIEWGDEGNALDDEYRWAGVTDPKVVITTSRDPSSKLKQFAAEMRLMFPNGQRINRGGYDIKTLVQACRQNEVSDIVVLSETRGVPDGLIVSHLPYGPTCFFNICNVVLRHDVPDAEKVSEQYPHLIFSKLNSNIGKRITSILKHLFPVPKKDSKRIITFANDNDHISFRHHNYTKGEKGEIELKEIGPRFEMKPYSIKLGTLENISASKTEWVLRPYMRSSLNRQILSLNDDEEQEIDEAMVEEEKKKDKEMKKFRK